MALINKKYQAGDFKEIPLENAPSLDIPYLIEDHFLMPKDGGNYLLFQAHVSRRYQPEEDIRCAICGCTEVKNNGYLVKKYHDVLRNNKRVDVAVKMPRRLCRNCKAEVEFPFPWLSNKHGMTKRLEDFLKTEVLIQPEITLSERTGYSVETISKLLSERIDELDEERKLNPLPAPKVLGIDEKHFNRTMHGILVNIEDGTLLDMLPDNRSQTMQDGIRSLLGWDQNIRVVTTDMNNSYLNWLQQLLPNATIVIDRFHVVKDVEQHVTATKNALVELHRARIKKITDKQEKARQTAILSIVTGNPKMFNLSLARIEAEGWDEYDLKLATVINEFPDFQLLHNLRYGIECLYNCTTREEAEECWNTWMDLIPPTTKKEYEKWCDLFCVDKDSFAKWNSFKKREFQFFVPYILNYFNEGCSYTNAASEGVNSLIQRVNNEGNGYTFKNLRGKCLYCSLVRERINYGIDISEFTNWTMSKDDEDRPEKIYNTGYINPRDINLWNSPNGNMKHTKALRYTFTETHTPFAVPCLNIYSDNGWIGNVLSAKRINDARRFAAAAKLAAKIVAEDGDITDFTWNSPEEDFVVCEVTDQGLGNMPWPETDEDDDSDDMSGSLFGSAWDGIIY